MGPSAVVFDRDQTLLHYDERGVVRLFRHALPDLTLELLGTHWARFVRSYDDRPADDARFWRDFWRSYLEWRGDRPELIEDLVRLSSQFHTMFSNYPDTATCIADLLDQGLRLALLTNHPLADMAAALRHAGVHPDCFDAIANSYPHRKPSSKAYHVILEALRLPPGDCLYVDNELRNVQGASAVGMRAVLLVRQGPIPSGVEAVRSLDDLSDLLA